MMEGWDHGLAVACQACHGSGWVGPVQKGKRTKWRKGHAHYRGSARRGALAVGRTAAAQLLISTAVGHGTGRLDQTAARNARLRASTSDLELKIRSGVQLPTPAERDAPYYEAGSQMGNVSISPHPISDPSCCSRPVCVLLAVSCW
jgi:hypothetical protein